MAGHVQNVILLSNVIWKELVHQSLAKGRDLYGAI